MSVNEARTPELGRWSSTEAGEPFGEWVLPGMGEAGPRCGEVSASGFCDSWEGWTPENDQDPHITYQKHLCGRRECPECWSGQWAGPRTVSVVSRLAAARYAQPDGLDRRLIHAVVSPPEDSINTIRAFYDGRRDALDLAKEHGVRGGVTVAHGYRTLEETDRRYQEAEPDLPKWRWIRANDRNWREQVYWSPHYHVIGLSRDTEPGDGGEGWVFRNVRSFEPLDGPRDRDAIEDMVGGVRYLLSHATFPGNENRQAVTWYGSVHGTNFDPEAELSGGAWSVIQRVTEEVVGVTKDGDEGESGVDAEEGLEECPVEGCSGKIHDLYSAQMFLEGPARESLPPEVRERVLTAYEWVTGRAKPPPGLKRPGTVEEARETLTHMLGDD